MSLSNKNQLASNIYRLVHIKHCFSTLKFQNDFIHNNQDIIEMINQNISIDCENEITFIDHWDKLHKRFNDLYYHCLPSKLANLSDVEMLNYLETEDDLDKLLDAKLNQNNVFFDEIFISMNELFYEYISLTYGIFFRNRNNSDFISSVLFTRTKSCNDKSNDIKSNSIHDDSIMNDRGRQTELPCQNISLHASCDQKNSQVVQEDNHRNEFSEKTFQIQDDNRDSKLSISHYLEDLDKKQLDLKSLVNGSLNSTNLNTCLLQNRCTLVYGEFKKYQKQLVVEMQINKRLNYEISGLQNQIAFKSFQIEKLFNQNKDLEMKINGLNVTIIDDIKTKLSMAVYTFEKYLKMHPELWSEYSLIENFIGNSQFELDRNSEAFAEDTSTKLQKLTESTNKLLVILEILVNKTEKEFQSQSSQTDFCKIQDCRACNIKNSNDSTQLDASTHVLSKEIGDTTKQKSPINANTFVNDKKPTLNGDFKKKKTPSKNKTKNKKPHDKVYRCSQAHLLDMVMMASKNKFNKKFEPKKHKKSNKMSAACTKNTNNNNCKSIIDDTEHESEDLNSVKTSSFITIDNACMMENQLPCQNQWKEKVLSAECKRFVKFTKLYILLLKALKYIRNKLVDMQHKFM